MTDRPPGHTGTVVQTSPPPDLPTDPPAGPDPLADTRPLADPRPAARTQPAHLLRTRLKGVAAVGGIAWALSITNFVLQSPPTAATLFRVALPGAAALTVFAGFWWAFATRTRLRAEQLRRLEVGFFAAYTLAVGWQQWGFLVTAGQMNAAFARGPFDAMLVARFPLMPWFAMVVAYGTFVPCSGRRAAAVGGGIAASGLLFGAAAGVGAGLIGHPLMVTYLLDTAVWLGAALGLAVFAAATVSALSRRIQEFSRLGPYQVIRPIGAGGMGQVFLARHRLLKRVCAVKVIHPDRTHDPAAFARFEREAQAMTRLSHWNIVDVFDYGQSDDGTFYYAMQYVDGVTLEHLVRQHGPFPPGRVVGVLRQACAALREVHSHGFVHRDLKPGNVLLCEVGGATDVVKLLDFGLVLTDADPAADDRLTREGDVLGTPGYMSPEQISSRPDKLTRRSDLYSLGALGYFLLTGSPPFVRSTTAAVMAAHLRDPVAPPSGVRPGVPADLEAVVLKCLEKEPDRRYESAEAVDEALAACRDAGAWTAADARAWWAAERPATTRAY